MKPRTDLTGRVFGRLVALRTDGKRAQGYNWLCLCECGTFSTVNQVNLRNGSTKSCGCHRREQARRNARAFEAYRYGPNHPNWNPDLTDEDRDYRRKLQKHRDWRELVFARDDYTCKACGQRGGKLQAHHLYSWAAHPERRTDLSNGVTLCDEHHRDFHVFVGGPRVLCTAEDFGRYLEEHHGDIWLRRTPRLPAGV